MGGKLSLNQITREYNGFKLEGLNLSINPGEYIVIVGPTGAGKTLLLETIQGFHRLDSGEILLDGANITQLSGLQRRIAYVPQSPAFPPQNTVKEILGFGVEKLSYDDASPMLDGIMAMMNLSEHLDRRVITLSGGEKRKLTLARALIKQPLILLLDEPLNNLDIISKHELIEELSMIHRYLDLTVIHVTHNQIEALTLADRIAVIREGKLVTEGTVDQVYNTPIDEYAARFLGYQNIFDVAEVEVGNKFSKIRVDGVTLRSSYSPLDTQRKIAVHGSEIILHRKTPVNTGDNLFHATISGITTTGPTAYITVDIGINLVLTMGRRPYKTAKLRVGEELWVQFSMDAVKPLQT